VRWSTHSWRSRIRATRSRNRWRCPTVNDLIGRPVRCQTIRWRASAVSLTGRGRASSSLWGARSGVGR